MNWIYQCVNRFAYHRCDYFLYLTIHFLKHVDPEGRYTHKALPLKQMVDIASIHRDVQRAPNAFVFAGSLGYTVEFKALFSALTRLVNEGIIFRFDIYGSGSLLELLRAQIETLQLQRYVHIKGVVDHEILVQSVLPAYRFGVSPYRTDRAGTHFDHMFYGTDLSSKLVEYIAAGLPIITTRLHDAFEMIETHRFGFLVNTPEEWYCAIKTLLFDGEYYEEYHMNAVRFSQRYDVERVLLPLLSKMSGS